MLKKINPTTSSRRHLVQLNNSKVLKSYTLLKNKKKGKKNSVGKNNTGSIVSYRKGGGHKKLYRVVDFRINRDSIGIIMTLEYDPNRNCFIASVYEFVNKSYCYIIAPHKLKIGDIVKFGPSAENKLGHYLALNDISVGSLIFNVSKNRNSNFTISRAAGTFSKLIEKTSKFAKIKLPSGIIDTIALNNHATLGIVSNVFYLLTTLGKAGRSRWLNKRPNVRGVAMNPVDHPHGGGEGKTSGGRKSSVTPWGKSTKGGKTKKIKKNG